ncbi:NAD(P)-dependent dehydrogenase (short-subunit alcohol dehydrogenase family) [Microbacteriaceae bacterium SG_E_30_P1]|uniref:NAD(P)-dependent dehydrogenase (Short-subunit alcohol dehydrogenase family) n=1 Tax=Antiquaquibacter oligotrophicus TaxID=2880260 RepID=A0ABT6KQ25_9MICO|nr:SDR family oxidoreductase [Antiquaquibacter oligotrophicus]MDH6181292.1 NAD(P)-dependent dehydrogenase (short-subunit alcohol dehydrogenase family) [Antiquaquibacter oligotrophicus]UDF13015.1 SDR family oxidoreductase [Antiquaquibacter oligotrophicus]
MPRKTISIDIPDLTGRRAIVTGGTDGIGLGIATRLAAAGADVILPARNVAKGASARDVILAAAPSAKVTVRPLDLASLDSVEEFSETIVKEGDPINILINNAGLMTPPRREETADGFELQLGTNHLGHFALVGGLLPALRAGNARVTSQVSVAANEGSIHWDDLNWEKTPYGNGMDAYRQSKIAFGLFAMELHRKSRAGGWGISSNLSHPGIAPTSLLSARPEMGRPRDTMSVRVIRTMSSLGILVGTPETAGLPALMAATSPDAQSGLFYGPSGPGNVGGAPAEQKMYSRLESVDDARRIWAESERMTGVSFPEA